MFGDDSGIEEVCGMLSFWHFRPPTTLGGGQLLSLVHALVSFSLSRILKSFLCFLDYLDYTFFFNLLHECLCLLRVTFRLRLAVVIVSDIIISLWGDWLDLHHFFHFEYSCVKLALLIDTKTWILW